MTTFAEETQVRAGPNGLRAQASPSWGAWGPNGGCLSATALRAAGAAVPLGHRPSSLTVQYLAAAAFGEIDCAVQPLREGRSAWCVNVMLRQAGRPILQAQVWTTNRTGGPECCADRPEDVPPPEGLRGWTELLGAPSPLAMWRNFDARPLTFVRPDARHPEGPVTREWYRWNEFPANPDVFLDAGRMVVLVDCLAFASHASGLDFAPDYVAPNLDLAVWFHDSPAGSPWLFADARSGIAKDSLIHGETKVWSEDGRLLASGATHLLHVARPPGAA